jgi:small conductance mechanosensitive channel
MVENGTNQSIVSAQAINNILSAINPLVIKIFTAIIFLFMGFIIGRIVYRILLKLFEMIELTKNIRNATKWKIDLSKVIASVISYAIYIAAIVIALNTIGITKTVVMIIVVIVLIILIFGAIFGANDFASNFFSGIVVRFRKKLHVGDHVSIEDNGKTIKGKIVAVNNLGIRLEKSHDEIIIIPSATLIKSTIKKQEK